MPRGRKPKPVEIRKREGNPGKRPLPRPIRIAPGIPEPSGGLPPEARQVWDEIVPALAEVGVVDRVDRPALEAIVTQYARMVQAREVIAGRVPDIPGGIIGQNRFGEWVRHPAVVIERDAAKTLLQLAEHFGLTPIARTRLGLTELKRRGLQAELAAKYTGQKRRRPAKKAPVRSAGKTGRTRTRRSGRSPSR